MREFGKTKRKKWYEKFWAFFKQLFLDGFKQSAMNHGERMRSRRRKTKFDR